MNKVQFIFSTRYLGKNYLFNEVNALNPTTPIYAYIRDCLISAEVLLKSIKAANMTQDDLTKMNVYINPEDEDALDSIITQKAQPQLQGNYIQLTNQLISKGVVSEIESVKMRIKNCPGEDSHERLQSRFSYYSLSKSSLSKSSFSAYAVPQLDWKASNEWIKALIDWSFQLDPDKDVNLYLVMHDKDVPGFQDEPYKYLTAEQISKILQEGNDDNKVELKGNSEKQCYYDGKAVNLIVFQHTDNDVVDLLNDINASLQTVADKLMTGNWKAMKELFSPALLTRDFKGFIQSLYKNNLSLKPDCSVDVCNNSFVKPQDTPPKKFNTGRFYYEYFDYNGALLTDLMHVRTTAASSAAFKGLIDYLMEPMKLENENDLKKMRFPIIIQVYKSFFDDWAKARPVDKERILTHRNKKSMEENLERAFSFFNNSSIWIRLVDMYDEKAFKTAIAEFEYFDKIGLYDYNSAWENLEYNLRIISHNYLESTLDGHGNYVTPMLYGNETEAREILCGNHRIV